MKTTILKALRDKLRNLDGFILNNKRSLPNVAEKYKEGAEKHLAKLEKEREDCLDALIAVETKDTRKFNKFLKDL